MSFEMNICWFTAKESESSEAEKCEIQVRLENNNEEERDRISHTRHFYDLFDVYFGLSLLLLHTNLNLKWPPSKRVSSTSLKP